MQDVAPQPRKYKRNIVEIHVDSCAQMGSASIHAVQALKQLYDAVGHKKLVYIETEQGLREKTDRTNQTMWRTLGSANTIYNNFLELQNGALEIHPTAFCRAFEADFNEHVFPTMVEPVLEIMDEMHARVQKRAYKIIESNDPEKLKTYGIEKPEDIKLEFYDEVTRDGRETRIKSRLRGPEITIKKKHAEETRDALWMATEAVHQDEWRPRILDRKEQKRGVFSEENAKRGSFVEMLRQHQQLGVIAAQLAFALAPEHMREAGYAQSPIDFLGAQQYDPKTIKENAQLFPAFSLLEPPLSNIPDENLRHTITMQALRLSGFWPWSRQQHMDDKHCDRLYKTHHNRADHAILHYFMDILPEKPDANKRALVVVTHDAPLIEEFAEFSTGYKQTQKKEPLLDVGGVKIGKRKVDVVKPLSASDYEFQQPDGRTLTLTQRAPDELPPHAALTGREFVEFVAHELNQVKGMYDQEHRPPPAVREAIGEVDIALRHLKAASAKDKLPGTLVTESTLIKRLTPHVEGTDVGGGILAVKRR